MDVTAHATKLIYTVRGLASSRGHRFLKETDHIIFPKCQTMAIHLAETVPEAGAKP